MRQNEDKASDDEEDLDKELDETTTSLPCEAAPRLQEADRASSAHHLADDLATEGAVEGNNGVLVLGEDGGLDAHKGDNSRKAEEERASNGEHDQDDAADNQARSLGAIVLTRLVSIEVVETKQHADAADEVDADVGHSGVDGGGEREDLPARLGGEAFAPEGLGAGHRDDLVGPRSVHRCYGHAAEGSDEDRLAWDVGKGGGEEARGEGEEDAVQDVDPVAAEAGEAATVGNEVLKGGADARGDGLLVDEGDGRAGLEKTFFLLLVGGFVGRGRHGDGGDGGLHHAKRGDDFVEHIRDHAHTHSSNHEAHIEQHDAPGRNLNCLMALCLDGHSALDKGRSLRVAKPATGDIDQHCGRLLGS